MLRYILKRIAQAIPLLLVISVLCFSLLQLAPYDAIDTFVRPDMPAETVAALKARYGLDQPAHVQYWRWLTSVLKGDFGFSLVTHQSVSSDIAARLPNTVLLVLPSYSLAVIIAIVLGLVAGSNRGGRADRLIDAICSVGLATPTFWIAMIFLYVFAYKLNLLPVLGMHTLGKENDLGDLIAHMILPCSVLTLSFLPETIRYVRSSTISQYKEDYVMVQQAFGASRAHILFKHVIKNVLFPVITLVAIALPTMVTGAFITESIFSWPGVGTYFLTAIKGFDYPIILAVLLMSSSMVILGNLLSDILYCLVDPRIKAMR
jgi:peptide/nickel transport system permease protein